MNKAEESSKIEAIALTESVLERYRTNRLSRIPMDHLEEVATASGVYFAVAPNNSVLYIGKANNFRERCSLSNHHKLPIAVERGATDLLIAAVPAKFAWLVEQRLIFEFAPELNTAPSVAGRFKLA